MRRLVTFLLLLAAPARADEFSDRTTAIAAGGLEYLAIDGEPGSGFAIQPTLQRTFDRLELHADYLVADWNDARMARAGALVQRASSSVGYQLRVRVDHMTLDAVVEAGIGVERIDRDLGALGATIFRPDASIGLDLRMLPNLGTPEHRCWFGMEMMMRLVVAPSLRGADPGFLFAFGVPVGR